MVANGEGAAQLGPYEIRGELGRGGMGVVYRGYDPRLQRDVAIKVLRPDLMADPAVRQRFLNEARSAARLHHPNLLPVFDVGEADGAPYMVMRFIEGGDLSDALAGRGPLPWSQAEPLLRGLAGAIDHAHAHGVIHRDLKPANVLLGPEHEPLLTDFGIARIADAAGRGLTQTGMMLGTPEYLSPEQAYGQTVDHRSDLYSFGVMAYQILTGRVPFEADTPFGVALAHVQSPPPDPRALDPTMPLGRALALQRMMAKQPAERYASASEFVDVLARASEQRTAAGPAPAAAVPVAPRPSSAPLAAGVMVLLVGTVLVLAGLRGSFHEEPPPRPPVTTVPKPDPPGGKGTKDQVHNGPVTPEQPKPPSASHPGWIVSHVDEVGADFEHPDWPQEITPINSEGYHATRLIWRCPDNRPRYVAVEYSPNPDNSDEGWRDLDARMRKNAASRYTCLALRPQPQHGAKLALWEYCLRSKDGDTAHVYKLGGWHNGFGVAVWGQSDVDDWPRSGDMLCEAVGTFRYTQP
jgi:serine/threonine-protein kinase